MALIGLVMTVVGLVGIFWCIRKAMWLRKAQIDPDAIRNEFNRLTFAHMASVGTAFMGLALLFVGMLLQ